MSPTGATYKGVFQLKSTFIDEKYMYLYLVSNPGLSHTILTTKLQKHTMKNMPSHQRPKWWICWYTL